MSQHSNARPNRPARGFTLVELMVVIVIIGILIGILIPSVGAIRRTAREASTKATFTAIETGLEMFKGDQKVGGSYPPSASDSSAGGTTPGEARVVVSPYDNSNSSFEISGAGLLVWALSGADLLGCPGFKSFGDNDSLWGNSTGNGNGMAYEVGRSAYKFGPQRPRAATYIDADRIQMSESTGAVGEYVVPAETKAVGRQVIRKYPMYLDAFGYPMLYWQADSAGRVPTERAYAGGTVHHGVYHWQDNAPLIDGSAHTTPHPILTLSGGGTKHPLKWDTSFNYYQGTPASKPPPADSFALYVHNYDSQASYQPHNPKKYLLISAGADGLYGTADDIANFKHNGQ